VIDLNSLATTVTRLASLPFTWSQPNRDGNSYAVTVVTPIESDKADTLRRVLRSFRPASRSPFAYIADVQFARFVIIDQLRTDWPRAPRKPSALGEPYLLFSADLTAPAGRVAGLPETFFRDLATHFPSTCTLVWGRCLGFPGVRNVDDFVDYLTRSQIEIGLYYAAFPNVTPDEIRSAIDLHRQFTRFVCEHEDAMSLPAGSPARTQIRDDYLAEFGRRA
jgi:hypothetical protein